MKKRFITILVSLLATGCASTRDLSPTIDTNYRAETAKLTFQSPNFSAIHMPPMMNSYAYINAYQYDGFCDGKSKPITQSSVNKDNKVQESLLPTGKVVAHIGYNATGAGGLTGESFYVMDIQEGEHYKVTLTEARPLVTSYSVKIEIDLEDRVIPVAAKNYERKSELCN